MTLPGTPGVVIGRTARLAWAVTNVMLDDHDLFFEQLDERGERVLRGDGWEPVTCETVTIAVRGADPSPVELCDTDRGPLLPADAGRGLQQFSQLLDFCIAGQLLADGAFDLPDGGIEIRKMFIEAGNDIGIGTARTAGALLLAHSDKLKRSARGAASPCPTT